MNQFCEPLESRRLLAAYILNTSFGSGGVANVRDPQVGDVAPSQTMLDSDGRLIVVTNTHRRLVIQRFHADGTIDRKFNGTGDLILSRAEGSQEGLVTVLHDNSIVIAPRQMKHSLLQRYTVTGKLDASFTTNGGSTYKPLAGDDDLYTDSQGRVVFDQYQQDAGVYDGTTPREEIMARVQRYLPSGVADSSFGTRGGISIDEVVDSPAFYKVQGKFLDRRGQMRIAAPKIDNDDNVIVAGARTYARGTNASEVNSVYSEVNLPLIYSFDSGGAVNRSFIAGLDATKATFVNDKLQYTGLQSDVGQMQIAPDNLIYTVGVTQFSDFSRKGLVVFNEKGSTFSISGFNPTFEAASAELIGSTVWGRVVSPSNGESRLVQLETDAGIGQTLALGKTFFNSPLAYQGVENDRPVNLVGFSGFDQTAARSVFLTEQSGSTSLDTGTVGGIVHVTGSAGEDFISITKRSDGRIVVTGAGETRSFPASVTQFQVDAAGGDDLVTESYNLKQDLAINGQAGNDTLFAALGHDTIDGGSGDDSLTGSSGGDSLFGQSGNDTLSGPSGGDHLFGGSGTDSAFNRIGDTFDSIENLTGDCTPGAFDPVNSRRDTGFDRHAGTSDFGPMTIFGDTLLDTENTYEEHLRST